ncbi:MAG: VOC family protein [Verrucomicrobiota bacterium]|nr:VOC family protein [Verrucomicrobiota bacterium]
MHQSLRNTIDYVEMPSKDLTATKTFFTQLFGWSFQDYGPDYCAFDDSRMAGGFFATEKVGSVADGAPLIVFHHPELEKMCNEVTRLGGNIIREIFEFPGGRRFHFEAPGGGEFGIWGE